MESYKKIVEIGQNAPSTEELFLLLQQASGEHCDQLGFGMEIMGPKGLIWVIVRHRLNIIRYPRCGEEIIIETWPGLTRHGLFPRHYEIKDCSGEIIAESAALWTLVDVNSRKMIKPETYGVDFPGTVNGREKPSPKAPEKLPQDKCFEFIVPEEYLDGNGHMNNTRYYRMAESCIKEEIAGKELVMASTEFASEALLGDKLKISVGQDGNRFYVSGETDAPIFKMLLEYR